MLLTACRRCEILLQRTTFASAPLWQPVCIMRVFICLLLLCVTAAFVVLILLMCCYAMCAEES
jgi:hypothetical protein